MKKVLLFLLFGSHSFVFSQPFYPTKDSVYIFWQEGIRITYNDYKGASFPNGISVIAEIGLWTVLDLPENTDANTANQMRYYLAPVFDRNTSHADSNDSILIAVNNIYFDICEVWARVARKKLSLIIDSLKTSAAISSGFKFIVKEMHENRLRMNRKFYRDFFRDKKEDALLTWRKKMNDELKNTVQWVTKPIECYRFILGKPIEQGFKEDLNSNAVIIRDKYEQVLAVDTWHAGLNQISRLRTVKK